MGWAIKRADGTYRCWNANAQDDMIQPGEIWEALSSPPFITVPHPPNPLIARIDAVLASTDVSPTLRALLTMWKIEL